MSAVCTHLDRIEVTSLPEEIAGCEDCLAIGDSWVHLRMCMTCGKIGCCDSSPNRHATRHANASGHPIIRSAEPGEVVVAGAPIVTIVDLSKVYLRAFVPEGEIGLVRVGQPARIYLDSNPAEPLDATVLGEAVRLASAADVCLVVGTSALVHPAAGLADLTRRGGGAIIEINVDSTPITDVATAVLRGPAAEIVPGLLRHE